MGVENKALIYKARMNLAYAHEKEQAKIQLINS